MPQIPDKCTGIVSVLVHPVLPATLYDVEGIEVIYLKGILGNMHKHAIGNTPVTAHRNKTVK